MALAYHLGRSPRILAALTLVAVLKHAVTAIPPSSARRDPSEAGAWWVGDLRPALLLRSDKPRSVQDVTLAIHYTYNRLNVLEMQCHLYPGPIAASVYLPLLNGSVHAPGRPEHGAHPSRVLRGLLQVYDKLSQNEKCILDFGVFTEELQLPPEQSDYMKVPVNSLRNLALALVKTEVVGIMDADFLLGPRSFVQSVRGPRGYPKLRELLRDQRGAVVLPALEFNAKKLGEGEGRDVTWQVVTANSKSAVVASYASKSVTPFHHRYHLFTDYDRWCNTSEPYEVYYPEVKTNDEIKPGKAHVYEPYVLVWREHLPSPLWDERFRGYHLNKIQGLAYLHHKGFKFFVHPHAFVVHWPHPVAPKEERNKEIYGEKSLKLEAIWDAELIEEVQPSRPFVPVAQDLSHLQALLA